MSRLNLLITGALGHIGSRLVHSLSPGRFDRVVLVDNMTAQRYCSLFDLPKGVPFHFVEEDICTGDLDGLLEGIDVVVHLAAITDAANSFTIQDQVEKVNFEGTRRVAAACLSAGARLIFPSTTSVYGTQGAYVDETCGLEDLKPQSPYAESKLRAEQHLQELASAKGLRCVIGRLGTIYGRSIGMRFHTAINKFVWQACTGRPLTVWRTAYEQKRPYLDVGDAVRAFDLIMDNDVFDARVYNILTNNATVSEIVGVIRGYVPDLRIEFVDTRIMNQLSYEVSNARFRSLGFEVTGDLRRSIGETVDLLRGVRPPVAPARQVRRD